MPMWVLITVFVWLLIFTYLTVAATWIDLGPLNIWIALAIAVVKGAIVCLYFMHLRYDNPFNGIMLVVSMLFVALFMGFAILDTREYKPNIKAAVPDVTKPVPQSTN